MKLRIADIKDGSLVDGTGVRIAIFVSGCLHNCLFCQNKTFQSFEYGEDWSITEILGYIKERKHIIDGITLTGGDPLFQYVSVLELCKAIKKISKLNIWLYTGFKFEEIGEIKKYVDVIVDGKYMCGFPSASFRGSSNQRIFNKINDEWNKIK
jgi:anaerobic ribonucleoside-triphosphate reductase activating protein